MQAIKNHFCHVKVCLVREFNMSWHPLQSNSREQLSLYEEEEEEEEEEQILEWNIKQWTGCSIFSLVDVAEDRQRQQTD